MEVVYVGECSKEEQVFDVCCEVNLVEQELVVFVMGFDVFEVLD